MNRTYAYKNFRLYKPDFIDGQRIAIAKLNNYGNTFIVGWLRWDEKIYCWSI